MIKSFLISLRRKPKVVRDQAAMVLAGVFTLAIFGVWAFSLPDNLTGGSGSQPAGIFTSFTSEIEENLPDFSQTEEEFTELREEIESSVATTSNVIDIDTINWSESEPESEVRVVRIATTSSATSTEITE